ncbi:MAG: hypothetical protein ACI840_001995 [Ulvibacter sp.]
MGFLDFIISVVPIIIIELLAAIAGIYYIKNGPTDRVTRWFVVFLCITVLVELVALYAVIAYYSDYKYFSFVECNVFADTKWIYNIYTIVNFAFLVYYFYTFLKGRLIRQVVKHAVISYILSSVVYLLIFEDIFFRELSQFSNIAGTLLLLTVIVLFYFQLLKSDVTLNLKFFLPFYISIGVLIFNLLITPIDIFDDFYSGEDILFTKIKNIVYLFSNLFMYSSFILGFIICRRKKSY